MIGKDKQLPSWVTNAKTPYDLKGKGKMVPPKTINPPTLEVKIGELSHLQDNQKHEDSNQPTEKADGSTQP